jgi:hypothetical protein
MKLFVASAVTLALRRAQPIEDERQSGSASQQEGGGERDRGGAAWVVEGKDLLEAGKSVKKKQALRLKPFATSV